MEGTVSIKNTSYIYNNHTPWGNAFRGIWDFVQSKMDFVKFVSSSFSSYLVEYALYSLLVIVTGGLVSSNVIARIVSSNMNYLVNRTFVFHENENMLKSAVKYFALAMIIMCGNTIVLNLLVSGFGINRMIAKIMTDLCFFIVNWTAQKVMVFE